MENLIFKKMKRKKIVECADLYIDTFSRYPWNDVFDSREKVINFFKNHLRYKGHLCYMVILDNKVIALCLGMKKPWIDGIEYYIDEFCVKYDLQGRGIGSWFIQKVEEDIKKHGMTGMLLNTQRGYPSQKFYEKNGFHTIRNLLVLAKKLPE
jgi:GNAT superfamily N-acetyltransferase